MSCTPWVIDKNLADFIESPCAILVATSDCCNKPVITRGFGARATVNSSEVRVFVTEKQSAVLLDNVKQSGQLAFNVACVTDYESYQIKGDQAEISAISTDDEQYVSRYIKDMHNEMAKIGVTSEQVASLFISKETSNLVCIKIIAKEGYNQTPGPDAGKPIS